MSLLSKAKSFQKTKTREINNLTKDELDLLFAYINGEIDTNQVAHALNCSQPNAYNKLGALAMRYLKSMAVEK